jgi:hypothetical protein
MALSGTHLVRALRSALQKAKHTWPKVGDRMEVRRQALKLRFWGMRHEGEESAGLLDLTYEKIKARPGSGLYELRLDDTVGGQSNIRVIFLVPPDDWTPQNATPLPVLWVLEAFPKKRQEWTKFDLKRFDAGRAIVRERFYET